MATFGFDKPQSEQKHPDELDRDLNPNRLEGQNIGMPSGEQERDTRTAKDVKAVHRSHREWNDADLENVPILPAGTRLQQGATYVDLQEDAPHEFTADGGMTAEPGQLIVPKDRVPYDVWNRLIGEEK